MNNKILQKVIEELKKKEPSIPYVLGMLETMSEMTASGTQVTSTHPTIGIPISISGVPKDEGSILDAAAKSKLQEVINSSKYE